MFYIALPTLHVVELRHKASAMKKTITALFFMACSVGSSLAGSLPSGQMEYKKDNAKVTIFGKLTSIDFSIILT